MNQRLVTNYLDTRGVIAEYDGDRYTLTLGSQGSHLIRDIIGGGVMKLPPEKMRVITPDVGGGFGTKAFPYREYALAAVAAERLRKPVRWICERSEHFLADSHGRDNISTARLAIDDKGRFLALELDIVADMGAYLSCYGPFIPWLGVGMATGSYDIPAAHVWLRGVYTNTVPVDAYRGAGRPEASYLIERAVDAAAQDLGITTDSIRRKNLIKAKALPYKTPTGKVYDSGDFAGALTRAQPAWSATFLLPRPRRTISKRPNSTPAAARAAAPAVSSPPAATTMTSRAPAPTDWHASAARQPPIASASSRAGMTTETSKVIALT